MQRFGCQVPYKTGCGPGAASRCNGSGSRLQTILNHCGIAPTRRPPSNGSNLGVSIGRVSLLDLQTVQGDSLARPFFIRRRYTAPTCLVNSNRSWKPESQMLRFTYTMTERANRTLSIA